MSLAVTVPGPCFFTTMRLGPSPCILMAMSLMLSTMSVTSSRTPAIDENSCSTPSMCTDCTAAPCSEDNRIRRSASHIAARADLQLVGPDQFLPVLLDRHVVTHRVERHDHLAHPTPLRGA